MLDLIRTMLDLIRDNTSLMSNNFEEKNEISEVRKGLAMTPMASFDGVSQNLPDPLQRRERLHLILQENQTTFQRHFWN